MCSEFASKECPPLPLSYGSERFGLAKREETAKNNETNMNKRGIAGIAFTMLPTCAYSQRVGQCIYCSTYYLMTEELHRDIDDVPFTLLSIVLHRRKLCNGWKK